MAEERDWPVGHPKASDYDPNTPEAKQWRRMNVHPKGERDWPPGHAKAADTPGQSVTWENGVDPKRPELVPFTGHRAAPAEARTLDTVLQQAAEAAETNLAGQ